MFTLRFFGSFTSQRKELLAATSFAPIPLHPAVQRQLDALVHADTAQPITFRTPVAFFFYIVKEVRSLIVEITLWNVLSTAIVLGSVCVTRELASETSTFKLSLFLAIVFFILKIVQAGIEYANSLRQLQIHRGVQVSLYRIINEKLLRADPGSKEIVSKGELKTLIGSDVESIEDFMSVALRQWSTCLVSTVVLTPALIIVSGWIGLAALTATILLLPVSILGAQAVEYIQKKTQAEQDSLTTLIGEWVKNIRLVRYLGWSDAIEQEVIERMRRYTLLGAVKHLSIIIVFALSFSWSMVPLITIFWLSSLQNSPLNLVEVFSTFWILDHLMNQIQHIPHSLTLMGSALTGARRVNNLLQTPDLTRFIRPVREDEKKVLGKPVKIILKDVTVQYGAITAIDRLSLSLSLSEKTAVVGSVGSGKSTLVELLVGERHPTDGEILIEFSDGAIAPLWREDVYHLFRSSVAYSPQQPFLSNTSMRLNIDLSGQSDESDLEFAAVASQLKPDIVVLPRLYDEEVGEAGINLSGGQKQRISLARAFISKREILVLDDPLSAVDTNTEIALMDSLFERAKGLIVVSHRLHELRRCDRIIVLADGKAVEDGTPETLETNDASQYSAFLRAMKHHEQ